MKTVPHRHCRSCGKRGFTSERDAEKALGRAQAKRSRTAASQGTGRGIRTETRWYQCDEGLFHLTSENRKTYEGRVAA